ncbi:nucleoporin Nup120/160-domain-containing protein [Poronia punctata]|nr:nucleoporin Nup120/160-domain-containing protein [Poronia punctata]
MATREPPTFFKETRLNFEPSSASFVVDVNLASTKTRRQGNGSATTSIDRDALRTGNCASASGIYHRKHHNYPKSFLWRVLEDNHLLTIRTVDVCRPEKSSDTNLILNFHFTHAIRPACVALSDPSDHDALAVFVLDEAGQLYTLFLRPDSFRKRSFVEAGLGDAVKLFTLGALNNNFKIPYRLIAVSSEQLMLTLNDGGHMRLDKNTSPTASQAPWKETFYNAKGWVYGIRGLIGSRADHDTTAAAAAIETNLGLDNASFLFTVCLDHRLRIWNLKSGQVLGAMDLLNASRDPNEMGKWRLDPSQSNLIRIIGKTEGKRLCVTYSPVGSGEFKFWKLESDDENAVDVRDMYPGTQLVPKPPAGSDVWTLADFSVAEREGGHGLQMWLLWKNNVAYRVQELSFLINELPEVWRNRWRSVLHDTSIPSAPISGPSDSVDASERWLKLILSPGRFPHSTLEAALNAYEQAIGLEDNKVVARSKQTIAESICYAIASTSSLHKTRSGALDYEKFRADSETHWRKFYRILVEMDKPRGEALALAYEPTSEMPWIVCADSISAIRECSTLEQIWHNPLARHARLSDLSSLILTGQNFVEGFSDGMMQICQSVLRAELFEETSKTDQERIQFFSDKAGFWRQISDEDCAQVTEVLGQNFNLVTSNVYNDMLTICNETWTPKHATGHPLTDLGRKVVVKAAEDIADLQWNVCFSQLILLVHMEFEFDRPEDAIHNRINIGAVYRGLLQRLARLELVRWLASALLPTPFSREERSALVSGSAVGQTRRSSDEYKLNTVLEECVGHLLGIPDIAPDQSFSIPSAITKIGANLCAPDSDIELHPHYIQCALLVRNRPDLAAELGAFAARAPFSVYIQGRVALALHDYPAAADYFKKAAYGMSISQAHPGKHSSGLLDDSEWNFLFNGMPCYYAHIAALYEKYKAYTFVIDFARLALQFVNKNTKDGDVIRKEMQSRLFSAATATSRFELAHSTIVAMKDGALQHSCLRALIQKMCDNLHNSELVALSFPGLQNAVDEILAQKCQQTLDVVTGVPYHQILFSWRIKRNDYRGAATILLDRIQKLRQMGEGDQFTGEDTLDTIITRQYLMLINVLSCVDQKQAWITTEEYQAPPATKGAPAVRGKRKVVTLADIRKEYQDELDRIAAIQNNQFGFAAGDEMEIL